MDRSVVVCQRHGAKDQRELEARDIARAHGWRFVERHKRSVEQMLQDEGASAVLALSAKGLTAHTAQSSLRFHPGMAMLRIRSLRAGGREPLVDAGGIRPGDRVLDATFGLGHDALVAAYAAGPQGSVLGLELSKVLCALAEQGLRALLLPFPMAPLEVQVADHREVLERAEPRSFDVVLLDPMFSRARPAAPEFEVLRSFADPRPLDGETLLAARRVCRRAVVVKVGNLDRTLRQLGLEPLPGRPSSHVRYGIAGPL